jgi:hypothetical protein
MSYNERVAFKQAAVRQLRTIAQSPSVIGTAVDVRDPVVGGSAVTATQTNLPANTQAGSSNPNVDMAIEAATTTTVGWHEASPGTADNLNVMIGTTQTTMTSNKVLVVFGVQDLTVGGDLQVLQFKSNTNIKAYVDVEEMYASDVGDLIGGFFVDSDSGAPAGVYYGTVINQPMNIQGMWHTNVAKNTKLRALVAETQGTVITTKTAGVS